MATSSSYYLNAPSLGSATAVFTDIGLVTCAPDGFYSNGVIVREQVGCVLLPQQNCEACPTPCGETINASGGQGIYLLDLATGSTSTDVGAVIVRFDPAGVPDGIRAILGSSTYNKVTSPIDGLHQSTNPDAYTFVGVTSSDCGISGTTYPSLLEYRYNGTAFVATGGSQSVTVAPGDVSLGAIPPGSTMMVIPKLVPSPSIINFQVVGPCSGTAWSMSVDCPVLLTGFSSSVVASTSEAVCDLTETTTYYNASLANTPGTVGLYDFVFADAYGSVALPTGFYKAAGSITGGNDWFQVNSSGVVTALGICPIISYNCVSGTCTDPGDGTGTYTTLEACQAACSPPPPVTYDCITGNCIDPGDGTGTFATLAECEAICGVVPTCTDRRVVFQICNSNAARDDNFDIYLNDVYIGAVDLSTNAQVGSVFIADTNTAVTLGSSDFACPLTGMVTYHFNPAILNATNVLEMRNTQSNNNGNFGTVGVRNYLLTGTTLATPCVIADLTYSGATGSSFTLNFNYTQCCPNDISVWYLLLNCADNSYAYSQEYTEGTFAVNDRVLSGSATYIIEDVYYSSPLGTLLPITATGSVGCFDPTVSLGSPTCRENNCNDNAACSVRFPINTTYAPTGSYITVQATTPTSTATVTVSDSTPPTGELVYYEPSGSATPVYFDLQLRDAGGVVIATTSTSLTHQSFWSMLPLCV